MTEDALEPADTCAPIVEAHVFLPFYLMFYRISSYEHAEASSKEYRGNLGPGETGYTECRPLRSFPFSGTHLSEPPYLYNI